MIGVISSSLSAPSSPSDQGIKFMSCKFLENLAVKRVADVQHCDDHIIAAMKANDDAISSLACSLLAKLANDEVRVADFFRRIIVYGMLL